MNDEDDDLVEINDDTNLMEYEASDDGDLVAGNVMNDDGNDLEEIYDNNSVIQDDADGDADFVENNVT